MEEPFAIRWKLNELLQREGVSADWLQQELAEQVPREILDGWFQACPERLELAAMGWVLWALSQNTGREYRLSDLLDYEVLIVGG